MYCSQPTNAVFNVQVQQILVVAFEFTGAELGFMVNTLCGPRGPKGWTVVTALDAVL